MSTTNGYFDETLLLKRVARANALGQDGRLIADTIPFMETIKAVTENSTMQFGELRDSGKDKTVQVIYTHHCGIVADNYGSDDYCAFNGTQGSTNSKDMVMPAPIFAEFAVNSNIGRTNEIDTVELYMTSAKMAEKAIVEKLAKIIIAKIEASAGTNQYTGGKGTVAGAVTTIPSAYWNSSLVPDLMHTAIINKFASPYFLDSGILWNQIYMSQLNANNANGSGDATAFKTLKYYADLKLINEVNTPDKVMYMIDANTIGVTSKTQLPNINEGNMFQVASDEWRWSQPMMLLPGFTLDVHYKIACDTATDQKVEKYKFILRYGVFTVPTGCETAVTGIIKMKCGA